MNTLAVLVAGALGNPMFRAGIALAMVVACVIVALVATLPPDPPAGVVPP